jgi:TPR repeat protein
MDERENLPAKMAAQSLTVAAETRGSLVARGMAAVLPNNQQVLTKNNDALYRQAREVYNQLTDDGLSRWFGYKERELPLTEVLNIFLQLDREGYGKAYLPLSTLYAGEQSIKGDTAQAERYHDLALDWLLANEHLDSPEIWHDLGVLHGFDAEFESAIKWFRKAADAGHNSSMWALTGLYENGEDFANALYWQIKAAEAGHKVAQQGLEQQHEHGDLETKIGDEQVLDWYVWSAEQGQLFAQLFLAGIYDGEYGVDQNEAQAAHWYLLAAMQGNAHAQLKIGKMYWDGRGIEQDYEQAEFWLEKSAEQGDPEAQYEFGQFLGEKGGEEEKVGQLIQCASDQGYGPAQYVIASDIGFFDVSDEQCAELFDKALTWYEVEAKFDSELRLDLALMHLDSWQELFNKSHRANRFDGLRLLEMVASEPLSIDGEPSSKNDAQRRASRRLGIELLKHPNPDEILEAIRWLSQAADMGDAIACVDLAEMYLCGHRGGINSREPQPKLIEIDLQAAVYWYERGIQLGWSTAACNLGLLYLEGKYLPQNLKLAEKWLLHSAVNGNNSARSILGSEYASGIRLKQDSDAAIHWLALAAEHSESACLNLAEIFLDGKITPRNFKEAIKWLNVASDSGTFRNDAMKVVVKKCFDGGFKAAEESAAQAWLVQMATKAIETVSDTKYPARDAHNAYHLGELYELGLGVEQNMSKAIHWYRQSAEQDLFIAKKRLDELGIDWKNT